LKIVLVRAGNTLKLIGIGKDLLCRNQLAHKLRESVEKWGYMKLKSFYTTKGMVSKLKRLPIERDKNLCQLFI
jgi:hypothetical protein